MTDEIKQIIEERRQAIPEELLKSIDSINLDAILREITWNNSIMLDKAELLHVEIIMALYGIEPISNFISNLEKEVGLPKEKAEKVAHEADEMIFKKIRTFLEELNQIEDEQESAGTLKPTEENRESILNEIENPTRAKSSAINSIPLTKNETPNISLEKNEQLIVKENTLPQKTDGVTYDNTVGEKGTIGNILETNLSKSVSLAPENKEIEHNTTKLPEKKSAVDMYREPIE